MIRSLLLTTALASLLAICSAAAEPASGSPAAGAWAERVQIVYLAESRSVERRRLRVWDTEPEKNLEFVWEPAAGTAATVAADGTVGGEGKLVWRVRGSASYDPKAVYSVYTGTMENGRYHGRGRLELRSGETYEGQWADGLPHGRGVRVDAAGNRYEGKFAAGRPHGEGRLLSRTGEIYVGPFVDGVRHGRGVTTLAGGTVYESDWAMGREIGGDRPDVMADALVGGLLKAQSGGGDAGKVEIGTVVDQRMTQQSDMQYQHLVGDDVVSIYPVDQAMNDAWNGAGAIPAGSYTYTGIDWEDAPAFVEVGVETTDGSRVKLQDLELQVSSSEAYRKPMLSIEPHLGCVGFRPTFSLLNHGWGVVREATMSVSFRGQEEGATSRTFSRPLAGFDKGADVSIEDVLSEAGVDTARLASERFSCPSIDGIAICRSQVFNNVGFGEVADFVWGEDKLFTTATGTLDYSWADDAGTVYQQSEPFAVDIALTTIEVPENLAECGDGFGGSPEALRYQDVDLPIGQRDYVVDLPIRGNKSIASYTARLKLHAAMSSFHQFQAVAKLADGSEKRSKPVSFFYFRPRPSDFTTGVALPVCYLDPSGGGCG